MERQITVMLHGKPYMFTLEISKRGDELVYQVKQEEGKGAQKDSIPDNFEFTESGKATMEEKLDTEERKYIAREIWKVIEQQPPQFRKQ